MSILNVLVQPLRAVVVVDTAAGRLDGHRREMSKLMHLAHANTLFACRGHLGMLAGAFSQSWEQADHFDEIVGRLPAQLEQARNAIVEYGREHADGRAGIGPLELVCVGWSKRQGRMAGFMFRASDETRFVAGSQVDWSLSPAEGCLDASFAAPQSQEDLIGAAGRQVDWLRSSWGQANCGEAMGGSPIAGGRFISAEITQSAITIRQFHEQGGHVGVCQ